ncbi:MAG: bifunctional diaminohydroxyphosphoribosylaminopyrimidine deaminase/5-amino-6-(5-phosphoribosylamino)uracil reductase RibD [Candidatus Omnitrophica bacterium]|nr:bifunctional diaminohydroxyphosphoribosylaminopyrimidine deaminase/5-amino-6-(5-phosphoribosylamino)uracil reductase RibD [Candidatus Omnitrophota bacterium]
MKKSFMKLALELAKRGLGKVSPNPLVGAVIVKSNKIIASAWHNRFGGHHAEVSALRKAGLNAKGATLYVNLEPCCHYGKTPPCADAIIKSKIKSVVVAMADPNPLVRGKGISQLRRSGIKVHTGLLKGEAEELNKPFVKYITKKLPFVTVKVGQSIDGKIATSSGGSKWITSLDSRRFSQRLRAGADAILVGVNTLNRDNPRLTVRTGVLKRQPAVVILDSGLSSRMGAKVFRQNRKVIIATAGDIPPLKMKIFKKRGIDVYNFSGRSGRVSLKKLLKFLAKKGIAHVLIEGGGEVIASALSEKVVDRIYFFIAPKIIGGRNSVTSVEGEGVKSVSRALQLKQIKTRRIGVDFLIEGYL